jgi:hypothetical protein
LFLLLLWFFLFEENIFLCFIFLFSIISFFLYKRL